MRKSPQSAGGKNMTLRESDRAYLLSFLKDCLSIPSVTGDTANGMERIRQEFESMGLCVHRTRKGALYVTIPGKNDEDQVLINAHMDTLGAIVKEIKSNGRLHVANIGGYSWITYEGENLTLHTRSGKTYSGTMLYEKPSVHNFPEDARETVRTEENMEIRLDEDVRSAEDVRALGIDVGDFISYDPRTVFMPNGYIKSRYLDDKACVAVIFSVLRYLLETKASLTHTAHFYIANYEEVGHGVSYIPEKTAEMLSLDIGTVGIGHNSDEHCVTICAKDSRTPYDFSFRSRLEDLARESGIHYRVDVHYRYGSDASMATVRGADVNFACIGPGVDATHHYERTHVDALYYNAELLLAYLTK